MEQLRRKKLGHCFKLVIILFFNCLISCSQIQDCPAFEFTTFGIDTSYFKQNHYLVSDKDSTLIKTMRFEVINKLSDTTSYTKMAKCNNGIYIDVVCEKFDFNLYYYFLKTDTAYKYVIFSSLFETKEVVEIKNINEVNLTITDLTPLNKKLNVKSIEVKNGKIFKIIDVNDRVWE